MSRDIDERICRELLGMTTELIGGKWSHHHRIEGRTGMWTSELPKLTESLDACMQWIVPAMAVCLATIAYLDAQGAD